MDGVPHATGRGAAPSGAAYWLGLAAAPVFAGMALLGAMQGDSAADRLCSAAHRGFSLTGMTMMYGLMSVFHAAPWIRLLAGRSKPIAATDGA